MADAAAAAAAPGGGGVAKAKAAAEHTVLEEDDEFQEFEEEDWGHADEDAEDAKLWQDNWDDDDVTGEFSQALRAAVEKASGGAVATAGAPAGAAPGATGK